MVDSEFMYVFVPVCMFVVNIHSYDWALLGIFQSSAEFRDDLCVSHSRDSMPVSRDFSRDSCTNVSTYTPKPAARTSRPQRKIQHMCTSQSNSAIDYRFVGVIFLLQMCASWKAAHLRIQEGCGFFPLFEPGMTFALVLSTCARTSLLIIHGHTSYIHTQKHTYVHTYIHIMTSKHNKETKKQPKEKHINKSDVQQIASQNI
jgi:hypothetical protein